MIYSTIKLLINEGISALKSKKNRQLFGLVLVSLLLFAIANFMLFSEIDAITMPEEQKNTTMILALLTPITPAIIIILFVTTGFNISNNLLLFFKNIKLDEKKLSTSLFLLHYLMFLIIYHIILFVQMLYPLTITFNTSLIIKILIVCMIFMNVLYIIYNLIIVFLISIYKKFNFPNNIIKTTILIGLLIVYIAVYATVMGVIYPRLAYWEALALMEQLNILVLIPGLIGSFILVVLFCYTINFPMPLLNSYNQKYNKLYQLKAGLYMFRIKKNLILSCLILGSHLFLLYMNDYTISIYFSYLTAFVGLSYYSDFNRFFIMHRYLSIQSVKLFLMPIIYFLLTNSIIITYLFLNKDLDNLIALLNCFLIYLVAIVIGIIIPKQNGIVDENINNFLFYIIVVMLYFLFREAATNMIELLLNIIFIIITTIIYVFLYIKKTIK